MTSRFALIAAALLIAGGSAGQSAETAPAAAADLKTPGIAGVVAADTPIELIKEGFDGTEGVVARKDGSIVFCEKEADRLLALDLKGAITVLSDKGNRCIGLGIDAKGNIVATQSRDPRIGILSPTDKVLAASYDGKPLLKPNDLVIDTKGGIYFSDQKPKPGKGAETVDPQAHSRLFYIRPDGKLTVASDNVPQPNGVQLSPDGKTLYAVNAPNIDAFDVAADGSLSNQRKFAEVDGDGMAVDAKGRIYVGLERGNGIQVLAPDGQKLGFIAGPDKFGSVAFGGKDRKSLYILSRGKIFRIRTLTEGVKTRLK